jgi:hypothetical protein
MAMMFISYITDASAVSKMSDARVLGGHRFIVYTELLLWLLALGSFVMSVGCTTIDWKVRGHGQRPCRRPPPLHPSAAPLGGCLSPLLPTDPRCRPAAVGSGRSGQ